MELCEENYGLLTRLAPDLAKLRGCHCSALHGHMDLYLEVMEQTPYTSLIHITYYFHHQLGQQPDPDAVMRVYHDARQVEVVDLRQHVLPLQRIFQAPGLRNKWKANLFVSKWLSFCLLQGHRFPLRESRPDAAGLVALG